MKNLLAVPYGDLSLEQRVNALPQAREEGARIAQTDEDGPFVDDNKALRSAPPSLYFHSIIEPAFYAEHISEKILSAWETELTKEQRRDDPRVAAFLNEWETTMRELSKERN